MGVDFRATGRGAPSVDIKGEGRRLAIVVARWNDAITTRLLQGAMAQLELRSVRAEDVDVHWVPGAFEIPLAAKLAAGSGRYDAVITLGCVIRGDTAHFEYVAGPAAEGVLRSQLDTGVPIIFGILTVENRDQALERSVIDGDVEGDNKGAEAVDTALEMISVVEDLTD